MNHLTHMVETDGCWKPLRKTSWVYRHGVSAKLAATIGTTAVAAGWVQVPTAQAQDQSDAYYEKEFTKEMKRHWKDRQRQPRSVRRHQRFYVCPRPCCGRQSTVSVYTDMEGVRKPSVDVRACAFCGVAWSVTSGAICDPVVEACEKHHEDEAWGALPEPVLKPF